MVITMSCVVLHTQSTARLRTVRSHFLTSLNVSSPPLSSFPSSLPTPASQGAAVLMNYCIAHPRASIVALPIAYAVIANHAPKGQANMEMEWW